MRSKVPREGPAWVDEFLSGDYFTSCDFHTGGKNERNQFCTECSGSGPLCQFGLLASHSGHRTLQVRKASHMDSIRVVDIQQCLEVSDIQTYSINSAKIVFLLSRPQPRPSKGALHACLCCNRALSDDVKFCSLACKLDVLREQPEDRSITFALPADGEVAGGGEKEQRQQPLEEVEQKFSSAEMVSTSEQQQHNLQQQEQHQQQWQQNGELGTQQKPAKRKRLSKRKKWTEKKGIRKKQPTKLLLPKLRNRLLLEEEENGSGCFKRKNSEAFQDSPTTPEKFESISTAKARCRKGVPRRAPMG
ncbi:uncharacterized protein LOC9637725 [Selaginella moellendorffii]|uniref:uncharacterized protein LOC9637725 n=1 Tax=Selaginella moellendorffii TaxID=88036 RepID=UPI000D1C4045|nr:uncharacterized protein LOC9637725 [Selaginella moellendorffii]|eukprot:XP_024535894.1 uncharacterized protein LOC9637725 [Selaginella moellendorffii]